MRMAVAFLIMLALLLTGPPGLAEELPAEAFAWDCPQCGTAGNTRKFCPECGAPRPSNEPSEVKTEELLKVGDEIIFGEWEQDNNTSNGTEPIEWMILDIQGDRALVISHYGLVQCRYAFHSNGQTWVNSSIRDTLNHDFYDSAFTAGEKEAILYTSSRMQITAKSDMPKAIPVGTGCAIPPIRTMPARWIGTARSTRVI